MWPFSRLAKSKYRAPKTRGQSLVEFALVSIFLFFMLLGIIEMGRLLYVFSAVSNAAQEGSRYAILRPRDFYSNVEAQRRATAGTAVPTYVVVASSSCNIVDKTREKVVGIPKSDVQVNISFDNGNGTPSPPPSGFTDLELATAPNGTNRIGVEATYRYEFMTPMFSVFAPSGITIKMRSARTIQRLGDEVYNCTVNYTPAPSRTPTLTRTATPTFTRTPTSTFTVTRTPSITVTRTTTRTPTVTRTATITHTATTTATGTRTPTSTITQTPTRTPTRTPTIPNPVPTP